MRYFNTTGPLNLAKHYCLDPLQRWNLPKILSLIDQEKYFLLHAPRQTGKTTCLQALAHHLNKGNQLRCVYINVEEAQAAEEDIAEGMRAILYQLGMQSLQQLQDPFVDDNWERFLGRAGPLKAFHAVVSAWCQHSSKPIVLLMDEADALVGKTLISMLRQLRSGYINRMTTPFLQSTILCGMRDIRDYRVNPQDRPELQRLAAAGSPFNIKSDSLRLGDFSQEDVKTLYAQHTQETGQQFEEGVCETVFELTQGQPWLVNALAYEACFRSEIGMDRSQTITLQHMEAAKEKMIQRRETHLEQLTDKLKQERVRRVIEPMLRGDGTLIHARDAEYVVDLGLLKRADNGELSFGNPIYREIIPRELAFDFQMNIKLRRPAYVDQEGQLCMKRLITEFQQFFRENSDSWLEGFQYKEAGPHLIVQAFLQRVINGGGTLAREYALGRGRTDLIITWPLAHKQNKQIIVLELKLTHRNDGADTIMTKGLKQTSRYMDTCGATEGHLLIFDRREGKSWDERIWVKHETAPDGKQITVWGL
ncbi:MAG: AAA-like domain-containing protein [Myxococcota bacterium]